MIDIMESAKTPLQKKLSTPIRLSPMVLNIAALIEALGDENLNFKQLATVLSQYPVIAARLMALANSAWATPTVPITTIENACARLGASVVKSMSIAIAVASTFNQANCPHFNNEDFWVTSILVSEGAYLLTNQLPKSLALCPKTAQTAGILHSLGLLWMVEHLPTETGQALKQVQQDSSVTLCQALSILAGGDYCEVGAWIGKLWQLPNVLVTAMQYHQDENYRDESWEIALMVGSALKMVALLPTLNDDPLAENPKLTEMGIDQEQQVNIFQHLVKKHEPAKALAKQLLI